MFGFILDSLFRQTKKLKRTWEANNKVRKEYRYKSLEKYFLWLSHRPFNTIFQLAIFLALFQISIIYLNNNIFSFVDLIDDSFDFANYLSVQWSIQATVAALVYPIVIGFVSISLKNESKNKIILQCYFMESSATTMGVSSLLLVIFMGMQFVSSYFLPNDLMSTFIIINTLWFLFNMLGTLWFLHKTIQFLKPDNQNYSLKRYLVNRVYPMEIEGLISQFIFNNTKFLNLRSESENKEIYNNEPPQVSIAPFLLQERGTENGVQINLKFKSRLANVWLRTLRFACKLWYRRAIINASSNKSKGQYFLGIDQHDFLYILVNPNIIYENDIRVCLTSGPTKLNAIEKFLIKESFRFHKYNEKERYIYTEDFLLAIQPEILENLSQGQFESFNDAYNKLLDLHIILVNAGFSNYMGVHNNFANLSYRTFVPEPLFYSWNNIYKDIFDQVVENLENSQRYFSVSISLQYILYKKTLNYATNEISKSFLQLYFWLWSSLRDWWVRKIELQEIYQHNHEKPQSLSNRLGELYKSAVFTFVGSWESIVDHSVDINVMADIDRWDDSISYVFNYEEHLNLSLSMFVQSIYVGDTLGSEILLDVLQKWWSQNELTFLSEYALVNNPYSFTVEILRTDKEIAIKKLDAEKLIPSDKTSPASLFALCLENYWKDITCIALYFLSTLAKDNSNQNSLSLKYIEAIIAGKSCAISNDSRDPRKPFETMDELFLNILRQYFFDGNYRSGYRHRLDILVEYLLKREKLSFIPGNFTNFGHPFH